MVLDASVKIPRVPTYSGFPLGFHRISSTRLSLSSVDFPKSFHYPLSFLIAVLLPRSLDRFGLLPFRSPLLWESLLFSLPTATKMFQFAAFPLICRYSSVTTLLVTGFPIRIPPDLCSFSAPRSFSQIAASFFGFRCQGIHRTLFFT